tara:strand:+ start:136 stop:354 length:219 start_codon:yes stop_codon:yes gene_type:complete
MKTQENHWIRTLIAHIKVNPRRDGHSADPKPRFEDRKPIFFPLRPYVDRNGGAVGRYREIRTIQFLPKLEGV